MKKQVEFIVPRSDKGIRLDSWLAQACPDLTRSRVQSLIESADVLVDGEASRKNLKVNPGMRVSVTIPAVRDAGIVAEEISLRILYEDEDIIAVDKAAGMVVHPSAGHASGTLVNALLHRFPTLEGIGGERRPGIVHRLDKDTSGVLIVGCHDRALYRLQKQFRKRVVVKMYLAIVWGVPAPSIGKIDVSIGRSERDRRKQRAVKDGGRAALTEYETLEAWEHMALLRVRIHTGRTHQIRVHLAYIGHPVVGDSQYAPHRSGQTPEGVGRQMLHAQRIEFEHPISGRPMQVESEIPDDMEGLLDRLRAGRLR